MHAEWRHLNLLVDRFVSSHPEHKGHFVAEPPGVTRTAPTSFPKPNDAQKGGPRMMQPPSVRPSFKSFNDPVAVLLQVLSSKRLLYSFTT